MIRITVASADGNIAVLYLELDWPLSKVKELIEKQLNIPRANQVLSLNGKVLNASDSSIISTVGIDSNDVLLAVTVGQHTAGEYSSIDFLENARKLIASYRNNPNIINALDDQDVVNAITSNDERRLAELFRAKHSQNLKNEFDEMERIRLAEIDPLNPQSQQVIEEHLKKQRIQESLLNSQEYYPESFIDVQMLYVPVEINKVALLAFVDTGSQKTVISKKCAEKCNIANMIDTRFGGVVQGVGVSKIMGRIHMVDMKINNDFYPISCIVVENATVDFILGLDILKRHQCKINFGDNSLALQGNKVHFVSASPRPSSQTPRQVRRSSQSAAEASTSLGEEKENKIKMLCQVLNIGKEQAKHLLESSNWDVERAASLSLSLE